MPGQNLPRFVRLPRHRHDAVSVHCWSRQKQVSSLRRKRLVREGKSGMLISLFYECICLKFANEATIVTGELRALDTAHYLRRRD